MASKEIGFVIENKGVGLAQITGYEQVSGLFESGRFNKGSKTFEIRLVGFDGFRFSAVEERGQETRSG